MPITMTNIIFTGKQTLDYSPYTLPPTPAGEVLVEATRTLISTGTEMTCFNRNFAPGTHWDGWVHYPFQSGYLFAGRVVEVGAGVTDYKPGDRVALRSPHGSHSMKKAIDVVPIPAGVSDDEAVWMGLGKIVQNSVRAANHVMGDTVVVIGLGMLGQLVVQYTRLMGAGEVIAVDTSEKRLAMAKKSGATITLNMTAEKAKAEIDRITNKRGADVVYDVTGFPPVFAQALKLARKQGKIMLLGDAGDPGAQHLAPEIITNGLSIIGSHDNIPPHYASDGVRWTAREINDLFLTYIARKQINVADLITHHFKPEQAREAFDLLNRDRANVMGVMFDWK